MTLPQVEPMNGADQTMRAPMRKVISLMHVSLDGYTAGPRGELDWAIVDDETYEYVAKMLTTVDTALYGRVTYHMMESYWPTVPTNPSSTQDELQHAHWVEQVQKIVFSRTLDTVEWNNTRLVRDHIADEVARLKNMPGKDLMIFGSPSIVHTLAQHGVIDEYRINVNPIVLGEGIPLFKDIRGSIALELLEAKVFRSGAVGLHYRVVSNGGK